MKTMEVLKSGERGLADHGWLRSRHTFSFADYYNPERMGFRSLRVINEDVVAPGGGFPEHPHRDMEIFSYVLGGTLAHRDSLGNGRTLSPGQIQLMRAGSGITHSEFNASASEPAHFLQIWIRPKKAGLEPSYTEWSPAASPPDPRKVLVISPDGSEGSATIAQDARVYRIRLDAGQSVSHAVAPLRGVWFQLISGEAECGGRELAAGDAAFTEEPGEIGIRAKTAAEGLLFDLA